MAAVPSIHKDISKLGQEVNLFGRWDTQEIEVKDISLANYIQIRHAVYLPHTAGRCAKKQFKKAQMPIVERLVDSLMMKGRNNGKKLLTVRIVAHAFEIIHLFIDQNPIQILVDAIINTGSREDSTRIGSQGTFKKAQMPIVERLVDSLMMKGRNNGKKLLTVRIVAHAFEIIHLFIDQNPIQILVDAIINTGPREDSTRIGSQGTVRRQAVDVSPLRRVNQAVALLTIGTRESAFRNVKSIAECLADELINAAKGSSNSYAIKKQDELERVAKSNR